MLRSRISKLMLGCAATLLIAFTASSALADGIVFVGSNPCFPAGVGRGCGPDRAPHVLSLQHHGTAAGGVEFSPSGDVRFGDWTRGSNTQTITFSEAGVTQASNLRIYFNINEPNGQNRQPIILNSLIMTVHNNSGALVFSALLVGGPLTLTMNGNGQGHSDYEFMLDAAAAARLQAIFNSGFRVGLQSNISSTQGGPESFFIGAVQAITPIPEPATMQLLGSALIAIGVVLRRRHRRHTQI
jgi:PEP-CTERM motif